jgi:hypothetical protein
MGKSTFFTGQPVLNQILSLIDRGVVRSIARAGKHDRYCASTLTPIRTWWQCFTAFSTNVQAAAR